MKFICVKLTFIDSSKGGRSQPIPVMSFGCPMIFENVLELADHAYDCRLLVSEHGKPIFPGETVENIKVVFLSPEEVFPSLKVGTRFTLWEGRIIASGEVISMPSSNESSVS